MLAAYGQQATRNTAAGSAEPVALANRAVAATLSPSPALDYLGHWTGAEGMFLDVAPGAGPDRFRLTMQYDLDHRQSVDARRDNDGLVFERDGARKVLRPTDGAATGLKYLAGKANCLTVAPGEGYCR